jgi:hypothetical protein
VTFVVQVQLRCLRCRAHFDEGGEQVGEITSGHRAAKGRRATKRQAARADCQQHHCRKFHLPRSDARPERERRSDEIGVVQFEPRIVAYGTIAAVSDSFRQNFCLIEGSASRLST